MIGSSVVIYSLLVKWLRQGLRDNELWLQRQQSAWGIAFIPHK